MYVENIMAKKTTKKTRKQTRKEASDLIMNYYEQLSQHTPTSDTKGKGQVKGKDIDRIQDYLLNKS